MKTYSIDCDADRSIQLIERDKIPIAPRRGEALQFKFALQQGGAYVRKPGIGAAVVEIRDAGGAHVLRYTFNISSGSLSDSFTPDAWLRGASHLFAISLSAAQTTDIAAGDYLLNVTAGDVVYCNAPFTLSPAIDGVSATNPPTPSTDYYSKAQADARYATAAQGSAADAAAADIAALQTFTGFVSGGSTSAVSYASSQSLTATQQATARANIGAAIVSATATASLAAGASHTPTPKTISVFDITLTGNATFANAAALADWPVGRSALLIVRQDSTGGRALAFGNHYSFPRLACIDPQASAVTVLRLTSDGASVRIDFAETLPPPPAPTLFWDASHGMKITSRAAITTWPDAVQGLTLSVSSTGGASTLTLIEGGLGGRLAAELPGTRWAYYNTTNQGLLRTSAGAPRGIAVMFDSRSAATVQGLIGGTRLGSTLSYVAANGGMSFGGTNTVSVPFTPNTSTRDVFVGSLRAAGGGFALMSGSAGYSATAAAGAGASSGELIIGGDTTLLLNWTGRIQCLALFDFELTFPQAAAWRASLLQ